jgi:hypothetical protein
LFCEQRLYLIRGMVQQRISEFARKEALPSLTRSGCAYLMEVTACLILSSFLIFICVVGFSFHIQKVTSYSCTR